MNAGCADGDSGGRARHAPRTADARPRQARRALRRTLPHHRFHTLQLHQQRPEEAPRTHAVQVVQPRSPHSCRVELPEPGTRRIGGGAAAAAAHRRDVVQGHCGLALPEYLFAGARGRRVRADSRWGSHLQDGLRPDDPDPQAAGCRCDHRLHPRAARRGEAIRHHADIAGRPRTQLSGEAQDRRCDAGRFALRPGFDGHLRVQHATAVRTALRGRRRSEERPRLRQEHHSGHDRCGAEGLRPSLSR